MLFQCPSVAEALSAMSEDAVVRVAVTGASIVGDARSAADVNPRDYSSPLEYRKALIAMRAKAQERPRLMVEQKARSLGLQAHSAESLNVVTVEGAVRRVLDLLQEIDLQSAVLECPMKLSPLPKPSRLATR